METSPVVIRAQQSTLAAIAKKYPSLYAQALQSVSGFGQSASSDSFNSILDGLTTLATNYGQYKVAQDMVSAQTSANQGTVANVVKSSGGINWFLIGGVALLIGIAGFAFIRKKKR
ncbi:MAG: LPXTG cell wall anchor domain-containing protein [Gammaproteobacteria bacterium]